MKEEYIKPILMFETFTLSQTIAKNCGDTHTSSSFGESNHYNENTCQWVMGEFLVFMNTGCDIETTGDPEMDALLLDSLLAEYGACYNNPENGQPVFSSM